MRARLHFAIATSVKPRILLIDEALAVGDKAFRAQVAAGIEEIVSGAGTLMLVSHSMDEINADVRPGAVDRAGRASGRRRARDDVLAESPRRSDADGAPSLVRSRRVALRPAASSIAAGRRRPIRRGRSTPRRRRRAGRRGGVRAGHDDRAHPHESVVEHQRRHRAELHQRAVGVEQRDRAGRSPGRRRSRSARRVAWTTSRPGSASIAISSMRSFVIVVGHRDRREPIAGRTVPLPAPGLNGITDDQCPASPSRRPGTNSCTGVAGPGEPGADGGRRRRRRRPPLRAVEERLGAVDVVPADELGLDARAARAGTAGGRCNVGGHRRDRLDQTGEDLLPRVEDRIVGAADLGAVHVDGAVVRVDGRLQRRVDVVDGGPRTRRTASTGTCSTSCSRRRPTPRRSSVTTGYGSSPNVANGISADRRSTTPRR